MSGRNAYDIAVNPNNKMQVYASLSNRSATTTPDLNGIYRSFDNGVSFTQLTSTPWHGTQNVGRIEIALAPSTPNVLYVSVERLSGPSGGLLGLWKTTNAWDPTPTWTSIPLGSTDNGTGTMGYCGWDIAFSSASNQCWYSHDIVVDPSNANVLYAGGIPLWKYDGATWTEVSKTLVVGNPLTETEIDNLLNKAIHVDQHALIWAGSRLVVGNDGGIWSTTDGGAVFQNHNIGLSTVQFYEGAVAEQPTGPVIGGAQDNGTSLLHPANGIPSFQLTSGGDGAGTVISTLAPSTNWLVSSQNLSLRRTLNGGANYASTINFDRANAAFIGKVEQCAADPNIVIAGSQNLARRTDYYTGAAGAAWTNILPSSVATLSSGVAALAIGSNCNFVAAGSRGGVMVATADGGASWINLGTLPGAAAALPRAASDFLFQPGDDSVLWVTLTGFNQTTPATPGHVVKVTGWNTGSPTFQRFDTGLNLPHNAIVIDPVVPSNIYVGTDMGVVRSTDGGATWVPMGAASGMPNVAVHDLKTAGSRLTAFTHGRGAFELTTFDLTGDQAVNCADLALIRGSVNKRLGDPGFSAAADLNSDNIVDVRDVRMMTMQMPAGTVCQ